LATFLALAQKVASESGTISGALPTTVVGQTGRLGKIVRWTADAWRQIQNVKGTWRWMQAEMTGPTVSGTQRYAYNAAGFTDVATSAAITRFGEWIYADDPDCDSGFSIYDNTIGVADEGPLHFVDWDTFYRLRLRGSHTNAKPTEFTITPDNKLALYATPDSADYRIRGRFRKDEQTLAADGDIPEMPTRFHDAIVDVAMMMLETHDENPARIPLLQMRKSTNFCALERDQLPRIILFGTLA
jgi:hypothetical protein